MKILFWNIQSGDPLSEEIGNKGQEVAKIVLESGADVIVFCEVTDDALIKNDVDNVYQTELVIELHQEELELKKEKSNEAWLQLQGWTPRLTDADAKLFKRGVQHLNLTKLRRLKKYRRVTPLKNIRNSAVKLSHIRVAADVSEMPGVADRVRAIQRISSIRKQLLDSGIPQLKLDYPFNLGSEAVQHHRHYLVFSKKPFKFSHMDVDVLHAKRQILILHFEDLHIPVVHAPAFGKGGAETAIQLTRYIKSAAITTVAIGDWNIDFEELCLEVEHGEPWRDYHKLFSKSKIWPFADKGSRTFSKLHNRTWRPSKGLIKKKYPPTQKSGGTLDYAIAPDGLDVSVNKYIDYEVCSDHAAIIVEIKK